MSFLSEQRCQRKILWRAVAALGVVSFAATGATVRGRVVAARVAGSSAVQSQTAGGSAAGLEYEVASVKVANHTGAEVIVVDRWEKPTAN